MYVNNSAIKLHTKHDKNYVKNRSNSVVHSGEIDTIRTDQNLCEKVLCLNVNWKNQDLTNEGIKKNQTSKEKIRRNALKR